jgi:hypothetical protein
MDKFVEELERISDEIWKKAGFKVQTPLVEQNEPAQRKGTISFVNGERARRMKESYDKQKGKK